MYKAVEWQGSSGNWYVNDVTDLASEKSKWWYPARVMNISLVDYIKILKEDFKVDFMKYFWENDILIFSWKSGVYARKYKNWINKEMKNR